MFFVSRLHLDRQPAEPLEHPEDAKFLKYPTRSARCASRFAQRAQEAKIEDRSRVLRPFSEQSKRELVLSLVCVIGLPGHGLLTSRTKSANIECLFPLLQSKLRYEVAQCRYAPGVIASM